MKLHLITFNVNGIRSIKDYYAQSKLNNNLSFPEFLDSFACDIICFQEHKTNTSSKLSHDLSFPKGYQAFYAFPRIPKKIGYSGVVTFVKESSPWTPIAWYDGFSGFNDKIKVPLHSSPLLEKSFTPQELAELDSEGRCVITDHFHFMLLNIYFPNDSGPERQEFRTKFYKAIHLRCLDLVKEHGKSLIILGDINITYHPLDHCEYSNEFKKLNDYSVRKFLLEGNENNSLLKEFYENPMRRWLAEWLFCKSPEDEAGWIDCFRVLNPFSSSHENYTCWNTQISARGTNYGTRIDTIFVSGPLFKDLNYLLTACDLLSKTMGSDHCPVIAEFEFPSDFKDIHESVLVDSKLICGNVPKVFGRLDSFFPKRENQKPQIYDTLVLQESAKDSVKRTKISDFFSSIPKNQVVNDIIVEDTSDKFISDDFKPVDIIQSQQPAISALFNLPKRIPLCPGHSEVCQILKVKKAGPNRGRSFYSCARPGGSKTDPNSRCEFFEWVNSSSGSNNNNNSSNTINMSSHDNTETNKR